MEAVAHSRHVGYPARKVRQLIPLVQGKSVEEALEILKVSGRVAAVPVGKAIRSAMHNMVNKKGGTADAVDMVVKSIHVDDANRLYRIRPRAQGRAYRIRKRNSHIKVVVSLADEEA